MKSAVSIANTFQRLTTMSAQILSTRSRNAGTSPRGLQIIGWRLLKSSSQCFFFHFFHPLFNQFTVGLSLISKGAIMPSPDPKPDDRIPIGPDNVITKGGAHA